MRLKLNFENIRYDGQPYIRRKLNIIEKRWSHPIFIWNFNVIESYCKI